MKAIYEDLLHLDRPFYEIHEDTYDPLKCIESFWDHYPLVTIREYLYALDLKCKTLGEATECKLEALQQTLFLADILRALMAYFLTHSRHLDTIQVKLSTLDLNMEEIRLTKKINDFFNPLTNQNLKMMKSKLYNLYKAFKSKRARAILLCLVSMFSLSAQTPRKDNGANGLTKLMQDDMLPKLLIGDRLPAEFWSQTLDFHYTDGSSKSVLLNSLKDRLIVIDFWATYCSPCVKSLDKWDAWQKKFPDVQIIPIHLYDFSSKALPFAKKRNWSLPLVFGNAVDTAINKLFYYDRSYGQIWIRDGRLFAIPVSWEVTEQDIENALQGIPPEMNLLLTHGEKAKERGMQP